MSETMGNSFVVIRCTKRLEIGEYKKLETHEKDLWSIREKGCLICSAHVELQM